MADPWLSRQQKADASWVTLLNDLDAAVQAAMADTLAVLWRTVLDARVALTAGAGMPPALDGRLDQAVQQTWREAFTRYVQPVAYRVWARQYNEASSVGIAAAPERAREEWWNEVVTGLAGTADRIVEAVRESVRSAPTESIDALRDRVARVLSMDSPTLKLRDEIATVEARLAGRAMPNDVRDRLFSRRVDTQAMLFAAERVQARANALRHSPDPSPDDLEQVRTELVRAEDAIQANQDRLADIDMQLYPGDDVDPSEVASLKSRRSELYREVDAADGSWRNRARLIARTVSTDVLNDATLTRGINAQDESGEAMVKTWLSAKDERVRPTHAPGTGAHGQTVPIGDKFVVGEALMDRPGDPLGPPEEVIQCRCSIVVLTADEHEEIAAVLAAAPPEEDPMSVPAIAADVELAGLPPVMWHGVITVEGQFTGDRRKFNAGSLTTQPLPMPIRFQREDWGGHTGAVVTANLDAARRFNGAIRAWGTFADGGLTPEVDEVQGLMATRMMRGVSIDGDDSVYTPEMDAEGNIFEVYDNLRIRAATFVAIPAYDEAEVFLGPPPDDWLLEGEALAVEQQEHVTEPIDLEALFADASRIPHQLATYWAHGEGAALIGWGSSGDFARCRAHLGEYVSPGQLSGACANLHHMALGVWPGQEAAGNVLTAAVEGVRFERQDFAQRPLDGPTPLTITDDGKVFGHLAAWGTCHTGYSDHCQMAPKSKTNYALFHAGGIKLSDGTVLPIGKLTVGGGHADPKAGIRAAVEHYDNSTTAVAVVQAHEDQFGIQVAGVIIPGTPPELVDELLRSPLSGDWRGYQGNLELIAGLGVNVPGFVVPRTMVASVDGVQVSLVAAGIVPRTTATLEERSLAAAARVATLRVAPRLREARAAAAAARINPDEGGN